MARPLSGVVHISPSFQFSTADLPFCNWAQRPLQAQVENAQLYLAALESTLQPQGRRRRRNQRDQPYLHQVYFPTKAEKSCQGCQLLRNVRIALLRDNSIMVLAFLMGHAMRPKSMLYCTTVNAKTKYYPTTTKGGREDHQKNQIRSFLLDIFRSS